MNVAYIGYDGLNLSYANTQSHHNTMFSQLYMLARENTVCQIQLILYIINKKENKPKKLEL